MKLGIIGFGHVGKAMATLFRDVGFENFVIYDKFKAEFSENLSEINRCFAAFVCVPTPQKESGECDVSAVCEVLEWCECEVIILRSTIPVGFTDYASEKYGKKIVFVPEYYGETVAHPFSNLQNVSWLTIGGVAAAREMALRAFKCFVTANTKLNLVGAKEAEMAKYAENAFLATKVTFCNELFDLCRAFGVDYDAMREAWVSDARIGRSHTFVYENSRGFGGSCLPKDTAALLFQAMQAGADASLLKSVVERNEIFRSKNSSDK